MSAQAQLFDQILDDLYQSRINYFDAFCVKYSKWDDGSEYDVKTLRLVSAKGTVRHRTMVPFSYLSQYRSKKGYKKMQKLSKLTEAEVKKSIEICDTGPLSDDESIIEDENVNSVSDDEYLTMSSDEESLSEDFGKKLTVVSPDEEISDCLKEKQIVSSDRIKQLISHKEKDSENQLKPYYNLGIRESSVRLSKVLVEASSKYSASYLSSLSDKTLKSSGELCSPSYDGSGCEIKKIERNFKIYQKNFKLKSANQAKCNYKIEQPKLAYEAEHLYINALGSRKQFKQYISSADSYENKPSSYPPVSKSYEKCNPSDLELVQVEASFRNFKTFTPSMNSCFLPSSNSIPGTVRICPLALSPCPPEPKKQEVNLARFGLQSNKAHNQRAKSSCLSICGPSSLHSLNSNDKVYNNVGFKPLPCSPVPKFQEVDVAQLGLRSAKALNQKAKNSCLSTLSASCTKFDPSSPSDGIKQSISYKEKEDGNQLKLYNNLGIRECFVKLSKELGEASSKQSINNLSSLPDKTLKSSDEPCSSSYDSSDCKIKKIEQPKVEEGYLCSNALVSHKKIKQHISSADSYKSTPSPYPPVSKIHKKWNPTGRGFLQVETSHRNLKRSSPSMKSCSLPTFAPWLHGPAPKFRKVDHTRFGLRSDKAHEQRAENSCLSVSDISSVNSLNSEQKDKMKLRFS